eukprot:4076056-Prymnesium_polylepis.1
MAGRPQVPHGLGVELRQDVRRHAVNGRRLVARCPRARRARARRRPVCGQQPAVAQRSTCTTKGKAKGRKHNRGAADRGSMPGRNMKERIFERKQSCHAVMRWGGRGGREVGTVAK